jgi:hypothetical protein
MKELMLYVLSQANCLGIVNMSTIYLITLAIPNYPSNLTLSYSTF